MGIYLSRYGVGAVVLNEKEHLLDAFTLFPLEPHFRWHDAITQLAKTISHCGVTLIGINQGVGFRYLQRLLGGVSLRYPDMPIDVVPVDMTDVGPKTSGQEGAILMVKRLQRAREAALAVESSKKQRKSPPKTVVPKQAPMNTAMADAFARLKRSSS